MEVNVKDRFSLAATVAASGFLADAVDLIQAGSPNSENQLDPIGVIIALGTVKQSVGNETYKVECINDVDSSGTNTPATVGSTGTITANDKRLNVPFIFVPIAWNLVLLEYLTVYVTLGGTSPSFGISGAWLGKQSDVPAAVLVAANYTI